MVVFECPRFVLAPVATIADAPTLGLVLPYCGRFGARGDPETVIGIPLLF